MKIKTDLTAASTELLLALFDRRPDWNNTPLFEGGKEARGNLSDLKKKGLITSYADEDCTWVEFTEAGLALAAKLQQSEPTKETKKMTKKEIKQKKSAAITAEVAPKKAAKKAARASVKTDALGSRIGSKANLVNEVLIKSKIHHTAKEIAEKSGVPASRVRQHLGWLKIYGAVDHDDEKGFRLTERKQVFGVKKNRANP